MQYYRPEGDHFVGDCMPFYHDGTFRLYYLLDENHHASLGGLGGHQWAQASSPDLVAWTHHPLAIPITEPREGSICTGSVLYHEGVYYGFYATRMRDRTQHLSVATSRDGIHFEKAQPNPFGSPPPGYSPYHCRDPVVFRDQESGLFHMLVTAWLEAWPVAGRGGCLAHLTSPDLSSWEVQEPFLVPGLPGAPECPDYFLWNGWYYLVFSNGGIARYRMSREPLGPWQRPAVDALDGPASRVMKTAPFAGHRRLGVAWLGTRRERKDDGPFQFAGNAVFRELVQHPDGSLGARFPREMTPVGVALPEPRLSALTADTQTGGTQVRIAARQGLGVAACLGVPHDVRLVLRVAPQPNAGEFGLRLRAGDAFDSGYALRFHPCDRVVSLNQQQLWHVGGLDRPFDLEIVCLGDIIDVCIDGRRTLIDRCPEQSGDRALFYGQDAQITFELVEMAALPQIDRSELPQRFLEQVELPEYTERQGQYLAFIYYYTRLNRQPPAEADMQRYFRVSAPTVHQMVVRLERLGLIAKEAGKARSIRLLVPCEGLPDLE